MCLGSPVFSLYQVCSRDKTQGLRHDIRLELSRLPSPSVKICGSWALWYIPAISELRRLRREGETEAWEMEGSLGYIGRPQSPKQNKINVEVEKKKEEKNLFL